MEVKDIFKALNLKDDDIAKLLSEETTQEDKNAIIASHKESRKQYYIEQELPSKLEEASKGKLPVISIKKMIKRHFNLEYSSAELNEKDLKIEDLLDKVKESHSENIKHLDKRVTKRSYLN